MTKRSLILSLLSLFLPLASCEDVEVERKYTHFNDDPSLTEYKLLFLTDLNWTPLVDLRNEKKYLDRLIQEVKPYSILVSGDTICKGDIDFAKRVGQLFDSFEIPCSIMTGDEERRCGLDKYYRYWGKEYPRQFLSNESKSGDFFSFYPGICQQNNMIKPKAYICVFNDDKENDSIISKRQLEWFDTCYNKIERDLPIFVFTHGALKTNIEKKDILFGEDASLKTKSGLNDEIKRDFKSKNVRGVFSSCDSRDDSVYLDDGMLLGNGVKSSIHHDYLGVKDGYIFNRIGGSVLSINIDGTYTYENVYLDPFDDNSSLIREKSEKLNLVEDFL